MRLNTINLQIVVNLGNYETMRIGAEWTPDGDQSITDAMMQANSELKAAAAELLQKRNEPALAPAPAQEQKQEEKKIVHPANVPAEEPVDNRELLTMDNPKFQQVIGRIEAGVPLETVSQYFRFSTDAERLVAELCEKMNKKK